MHMPHSESAGTNLALDSKDYNLALANVVQHAGTTAFYRSVAALLARLTGCRDHLVMRYPPFGVPTFLVNEAMDAESVQLYLDGLYGLDPLRKLSRQAREPCVVSLRSLGEGAPADERYLLELFKSAFIFDELAILLPAPGGVSIAVCCERRSVRFRDKDRAMIERILPVVASLHKLHVDRAFALASARGETEVAGQQHAFLVLDQGDRVVHESDYWRRLELSSDHRHGVLRAASAHAHGEYALDDDYVAHWEGLAADFPLAPGGKIITIERRGAISSQFTLEGGLQTFVKRWNLTDRESEIVRLILIGYPTPHIARALGISSGTVRNHRHRLYYKLDITTERELFSMFLSQIIGKEIAAPAVLEAAAQDS